MIWVSFADKTAFAAYHDRACADRGIPKPGQNQASGQDALDAQWTTAWVRPVMDGLIIKALVPDTDASTYKLTPTTAPATVTSVGGMTTVTATKTLFDAECDKPLPNIWNGELVPTATTTTTTASTGG